MNRSINTNVNDGEIETLLQRLQSEELPRLKILLVRLWPLDKVCSSDVSMSDLAQEDVLELNGESAIQKNICSWTTIVHL